MKSGNTVAFGITDSQSLILIAPLIDEFRTKKWSTILITGGKRDLKLEEVHELKIHWIKHLLRKPAPLRDLLATYEVYKHILDERPTLVVFGTPKISLIGMIAARICKVEHRAYIARGSLVATSAWLIKPWLWLAEALTCALATKVIAVSQSLGNELVASRIISKDSCLVIGEGSSHGVSLTQFHSLRVHRESPCNIGFVGRLSKDKGLDILIEAFRIIQAEFPSTKLYLVGKDDGLLSKLTKIVDGNSGIVFRPETQHGEALFEGFDILCLPSRREGFPNVVLEAGALGIPAVASNVTGSRDAVLSGITGTLVAPDHPQALSRELRRLMVNPLLRQQLGENARSRIERSFRENKVTRAYYAELTRGVES